jgi:oligo-1,6-glucosidase
MNELYPNDTEKLAYARKVLQRKARDNTRVPMQWTSDPNAGFCAADVKPWMRVNDDYIKINAEAQSEPSPNSGQMSVHAFWKRGLESRKKHKDAFVYGNFSLVGKDDDESVIAYKRFNDTEAFITLLNFSDQDTEWEIPADIHVNVWVAGNYPNGQADKSMNGQITLRPWEALLGIC